MSKIEYPNFLIYPAEELCVGSKTLRRNIMEDEFRHYTRVSHWRVEAAWRIKVRLLDNNGEEHLGAKRCVAARTKDSRFSKRSGNAMSTTALTKMLKE
ncbi:hypothetical protein B296_00020360 [Ensete ventricosum]|uniref:Uncharacterized protein n=1 Tax=Ensete ventricosum TaxID=4639 RepID=A0A427AGG5_ENSVE|nr:hypothetical protein B296_00020360 [Ensete ventricosum]